MSQSSFTTESQPQVSVDSSRTLGKKWLIPALVFFIIAIAGVFYVKWNPYFHKAFLAASKHSIGASIVTGNKVTAPSPSWEAAMSYAIAYFKAVWQAVILGLLLGSLVQVLLPKNWIFGAFGKTSFGSTLFAGIAGVPSMMCTCCAAPVAVGLRQRSASVSSTLAFWMGNPVLNPATLIFMGFVLSWKFVLIRIVFGILLVFGLSYFANRFALDEDVSEEDFRSLRASLSSSGNSEEETRGFLSRWWQALWPLIRDTIPAYLIVVFLLGAVRAWLFPAINPSWGNSLLVILGFALAGTLFIIPTAGEIPIVQSLMSFGLGMGPAATLIMTLPAISLPSLLMVKRVFPVRVLLFVTGGVIAIGIVSGVIAGIFL